MFQNALLPNHMASMSVVYGTLAFLVNTWSSRGTVDDRIRIVLEAEIYGSWQAGIG